jgi:hypothetical protein
MKSEAFRARSRIQKSIELGSNIPNLGENHPKFSSYPIDKKKRRLPRADAFHKWIRVFRM